LIATGVTYLLATCVFELTVATDPTLIAVGLAAGAVIVGSSGIVATYSVVRQPPMRVLPQ
jgi:hypothetical protein